MVQRAQWHARRKVEIKYESEGLRVRPWLPPSLLSVFALSVLNCSSDLVEIPINLLGMSDKIIL